MREVNSLSETLRRQRIVAIEATSLLRGVMEEIDVSVFAFDETGRLRLVNRAGGHLLTQKTERLIGRTAEQLGLGECLAGADDREADAVYTLRNHFLKRERPWGIQRSEFRCRTPIDWCSQIWAPAARRRAHAWQASCA